MKRYLSILSLMLISALTLSCGIGTEQGKGEESSVPKKSSVPQAIDPEHFTILSWTGISNQHAEFGFTKLMEAGFNTYLDWYDNLTEAEYALGIADNVGIKMVLKCPELIDKSKTREAVESFCKHKSFFVYHIEDEPEVSEFSDFAGQIENIRLYDTDHPCYINLYPNWCWGESAYKTRVLTFVKTVPVKFLSFDNYPCKSVGGVTTVRPDWYHNLEDIRAVAKDNKMPFWGFALSLAHSTSEATYPIPTIGEMRLQQFSNLVYGATGFQYFTTWGHIQNDHLTNVYETIKKVNGELIGMEPIFLNADIKYVWHMGKDIPSGTKKLTKAPAGISKLETDDGGAVVSYLVNNDKQYIAIVNKNPNGGMNLTIEFDTNVKAFKVDKSNNIATFTPGTIRLAAGDIAIYSWE